MVFFGTVYLIPQVVRPRQTLIAVNVGGAVIPVILSVYLLVHTAAWLMAAAATLAVTVAVRFVARPVPGLGIAVPALFPGAAAAVASLLLASPARTAPVAFVAGTCGTLIGADLLNLHRVPALGAPVASIGGAGTFDGVFIAGIVAVVLVTLNL